MRPTYGVHIVWHYFVLESSTSFSQVLWSMLWPITSNPNPKCSKNWKMKNKSNENENEKENKRKRSPFFMILTQAAFPPWMSMEFHFYKCYWEILVIP